MTMRDASSFKQIDIDVAGSSFALRSVPATSLSNRLRLATDAENVRWLVRAQFNVIRISAPEVAGVGEKIMNLITITLHLPDITEGKVNKGLLCSVWVKVHHNQDNVVARWSHFPVTQDRVVVRSVESKVVVELESPVVFSDPIETRNPFLDIAWRIPITLFPLIFLRVTIFLASRESIILTELEATVDPVNAG
jgi:hypothetical protein